VDLKFSFAPQFVQNLDLFETLAPQFGHNKFKFFAVLCFETSDEVIHEIKNVDIKTTVKIAKTIIRSAKSIIFHHSSLGEAQSGGV
jgi:orotidine-5'-phosphate decarboxylase